MGNQIAKLKVTKIGKFKVYFRNKEEFFRIKKETFVEKEYKFISTNTTPFIIDGGSHIGLPILYFKSIYPDAEILGFEPDPQNFEILQKNINENNLKNVKVINAALSDKEDGAILRTNPKDKESWTWGNTIINNMWGDEGNSKINEVKTVRLSKYIDRPVDLLKLDIEGSEQTVLTEIKDKLHFIKQINMEFHVTPTNKNVNNYEITKKLLKDNLFKVKTYTKFMSFPFPDFILHLINTTWLFSVKAAKS